MLQIAFHPIFAHPLPEGHRFPMLKYELIPEQLLYEGTISKKNIHQPKMIEEEIVLWTHELAYWRRLKYLKLSDKEIRRIGFPLTKELIERELIISQGTIDCANFAIKNGCALNVAGGTHHAGSNWGEGYCLLNDVAIAANYLLKKNICKKVLIIDLDVHQGNGTAEIFSNNPSVFTFSMHGANNFPYRKELSTIDIGLIDQIKGEIYLEILSNQLDKIFLKYQPDFIFYISGVDVLETDQLGKLALSKEDCKARDFKVIETCYQKSIPIAICMGGGYSKNIIDIVDAHCNTFRIATAFYEN